MEGEGEEQAEPEAEVNTTAAIPQQQQQQQQHSQPHFERLSTHRSAISSPQMDRAEYVIGGGLGGGGEGGGGGGLKLPAFLMSADRSGVIGFTTE